MPRPRRLNVWLHERPRILQPRATAPLLLPQQVWIDGSGIYPKDALLRTTGWAVAWQQGDLWCTTTGATAHPETVPRSELSALVAVLQWPAVLLQVHTDCKAVMSGFQRMARARKLPDDLLRGTMGDLWLQCFSAWGMRAGIYVTWMPAHQTLEQLLQLGFSEHDYQGNVHADAAAKAQAIQRSPPAELCTFLLHRQKELLVMRIVAAVHEAALNTRQRTPPGGDVQTRKRKWPMPLSRQVKARVLLPAFQMQPLPVVLTFESFSSKAERVRLTQEQLLAQLWAMPPHAQAGLHDLRPVVGPLPAYGSVVRPPNGVCSGTSFARSVSEAPATPRDGLP